MCRDEINWKTELTKEPQGNITTEHEIYFPYRDSIKGLKSRTLDDRSLPNLRTDYCLQNGTLTAYICRKARPVCTSHLPYIFLIQSVYRLMSNMKASPRSSTNISSLRDYHRAAPCGLLINRVAQKHAKRIHKISKGTRTCRGSRLNGCTFRRQCHDSIMLFPYAYQTLRLIVFLHTCVS